MTHFYPLQRAREIMVHRAMDALADAHGIKWPHSSALHSGPLRIMVDTAVQAILDELLDNLRRAKFDTVKHPRTDLTVSERAALARGHDEVRAYIYHMCRAPMLKENKRE